MNPRWLAFLLLPAAALLSPATAQDKKKEKPPPPSDEVVKSIKQRADRLGEAVARLRDQGVRDPILSDVEVYHRAAEWLLAHNAFWHKDSVDWTNGVLDRGLLRASQAARGESPWLGQTGRTVARGYRSRIDGTVQPYAVTFPADHGRDPKKKSRVDVVLHGRNDDLTEVAFLNQHRGDKPADANCVRIDVFGRGNNAYRWAGETDVDEAVEAFLGTEAGLGRDNLLDPSRFVLRGFSMGGAGVWHLGLHRPGRWCVIGPGAGFSRTHGKVNLPKDLPAHINACLHIYDAVDYAENARMVPVIAYSGADDAQIDAARTIEGALKGTGVSITHLVAPGVKHAMPPEWAKKVEEEYARHASRGKPEYPNRVRFVTWTLKYPVCDWVEILALGQHYKRAMVDAERTDTGFNVTTENVRALQLQLPIDALQKATPLTIDGQKLEPRPSINARAELHLYLEKRDGKWTAVLPERLAVERLRGLHKVGGLQGPIDDAFMGPFLCVIGTGTPWNESAQEYADAALERFKNEWSRYMHGELMIKKDVDVTSADLATRHLILFGDPGSNSLIEQSLAGLPIKWTKDVVQWEGKDYAAKEHVPVLIYPSPLATDRYVVLNSGHTFHEPDFKGTNALLYPRLGDHALLKLAADKKKVLDAEVVRVGLFDEAWRFPK